MTTTTDKEAPIFEEIERLLEVHIGCCRKAVSECKAWSPAQAEWSRARDALLNFQDDFNKLRAQSTLEGDGSAGRE